MPEELLVKHCSPTLAGLKTGSLFTCTYQETEDLREAIRSLNKLFVPRGLRALPLRCRSGRALIYVYRPNKLKQDLEDCLARQLLTDLGYPVACSQRCIVRLVERIREKSSFPHEIGLFLGYPPEDVRGFMEDGADKYKCTGCWKVYGNEESAKVLFARYKKCTKVYYEQWTGGKSIERLIVAV